MKRSCKEIEDELAFLERQVKKARNELADHEDTLETILPRFLFKRLVACKPRILKSLRMERIDHADSFYVAAGTVEVSKTLWRCRVRLVGHPALIIEAERWGLDSDYELPKELSWMAGGAHGEGAKKLIAGVMKKTLAETWEHLLGLCEQRVDMALAAIAFEAVLNDEDDPNLRHRWPDADEEANPTEELFDEQTCVVCLERLANTLVLPCMHQVCCRECSGSLKATLNAKRCVLCRHKIDDVLQDEVAATAADGGEEVEEKKSVVVTPEPVAWQSLDD